MVERAQYLVLGSMGQVGARLCQLLGERAIPVHRGVVDLSDLSSLQNYLQELPPIAAIFNAAAYTQVDKAETEKDLAFTLNSHMPQVLARFCAEKNIPLVHYSTDYVFSGEGSQSWHEDDLTQPLSVYGASKRDGELAIANQKGRFLIFRTSWVFDSTGKNFVRTILRLSQEKPELKIVADQFGAPTSAADLAKISLECLECALKAPVFPSGIYNCSNGGVTNWFEFAKAIVELSPFNRVVEKVLPIETREFPTPAQRPKNSRLDMSKLQQTFGVEMPPWQDALKRCLSEIAALQPQNHGN